MARPANKRYGQSSLNPNGWAEYPNRCVDEVWNGARQMTSSQCSRKRGHGLNGEWCKQHAVRQGKAASVIGAMMGEKERLALCDKHGDKSRHFQECPCCVVIKYERLLSEIDFQIAGNDDPNYQMAPFDIDYDEDAVLVRVKEYVKKYTRINILTSAKSEQS